MKVFVRILTVFVMSFVIGAAVFGQNDPAGKETDKAATQTRNAQTVNESELYRIGYQDSLDIQFIRHPELNQKVNINPDGSIILGRATAPIMAVCRTERELADAIAKDYQSFLKKPVVSVFVSEKKSQSYGVIGSVEKAGTFFVNRRIRLLELLAFAGGPNKEAGSRMIVARTGSTSACRDKEEKTVDSDDMQLMSYRIKDVIEGKQNLWMKPGDIISVLDADEVYVYGNVKKVGSVKMKEPITLTQAIVSAEGLTPTAKSKVRIIRRVDGSAEPQEFTFDLKDIEKKKQNDPYLEPNDIVAISEDSSKVILRGFMKTIQQGVPSLFYRVP
ncbi:MAG: SLBB domain-containing protein [Acidobacteria bacterium]|nr:SLBB domain-containing protein [Acidobacteriota bacterium]